MSAAPSTLIRASMHDEVWHITLARPQQRNALTPEMIGDLLTALRGTPAQARVVLLDGEGKVFCAGFDLERCQGEAGINVVKQLLIGLHECVQMMAHLMIPVVVCVQGAAIAGGCALITEADAVISHSEAQFGYPAARLGLSPAVSAPTLAQHIGMGPARTLQLDGGLVSGSRALEVNLVTHLTDREAISALGLSVAQGFANKPREATRSTRQLVQSLAPMLSSKSGMGRGALEASLAGAGTPEQLTLLAQAWAATRPKPSQNI
ncbi:MAG: enoyl-CoA hydratase/isomerase family protein [Planctomycetes bacterium]|nr:enoyl-CoA hydratase/isomerase family protein [Planctomycetota bacterium]